MRVNGLAISAIGTLIFLTGACSSPRERENLDAIKLILHDPYSAQFTEVRTVEGDTCGLVNAKNLMGAYTGVELFYVDNGIAYIGTDAMQRSLENPDVCSVDATMSAVSSSLGKLRD